MYIDVSNILCTMCATGFKTMTGHACFSFQPYFSLYIFVLIKMQQLIVQLCIMKCLTLETSLLRSKDVYLCNVLYIRYMYCSAFTADMNTQRGLINSIRSHTGENRLTSDQISKSSGYIGYIFIEMRVTNVYNIRRGKKEGR